MSLHWVFNGLALQSNGSFIHSPIRESKARDEGGKIKDGTRGTEEREAEPNMVRVATGTGTTVNT